MRNIVEGQSLAKNYGDFQAVKGISFNIEEGEIFSLLGPNGAGKTTTISMLSTGRNSTLKFLPSISKKQNPIPGEILNMVRLFISATTFRNFSPHPSSDHQ
jgi:ABC-type branched-subunit amino acid transport system ATPase component